MYIVTGGSDGLGFEIAEQLGAAGETVVSLSRSKPKTQAAEHIVCDLTNESSINAAADMLLKRSDVFKGLINCAGVSSRQPLATLVGKELARTYTTNVIGPMLLTARLLERIKKDGADIVNVASTAGLKGNPDEAAYSSSKWAMRGFTQNLQVELKGTPCRVISFCPGGMNTKFFTKHDAAHAPDNSQWMDPFDIAHLVLTILELPKNIEVSEIVINRK